jgi:glutamate-ammonia-ligase adenylyltransferase
LNVLSKLAVEVMELLSRRTESGIVFHVDARLRPDGEKGVLVNNLKAYREYYERRAMLWEIQSLTRVRPIAGDSVVGAGFVDMARRLTNFQHPDVQIAAWSLDWKQKIHQMRLRIEKERTPKGKDALAIKTGSGGVMDAEFISQAVCLSQGWQEPNTLKALERAAAGGALPLPEQLLGPFRALRRVEGVLRRWSYEGETVLPDAPAPFYRVAIRCGFPDAAAFERAVNQWRGQIRRAYNAYFLNEPAGTKKG